MFNYNFQPPDKFFSSATNRTYDCTLPPGTTSFNCHSENIIYLIT